MPDTVVPKTQTTSPLAACFQCFSPRWSAIWAPHHCKPRPRRYQAGGIAPCKGATRRRHAARGLRMAQNPHRYQCRARCRGGRARMGHRWVVETRQLHTRKVPRRNKSRPARAARPNFRYKTLPAHPLAPHVRDKTLPACPPSPHFRYKTLPAHPKWLDLAQSTHAGRVLYRFHHQEAEQGEFCTERKAEMGLATTAHQALPVWRTSEGPEGTGGFEATRKVAHQRPGPTGMEDVGEPGGPGRGASG